MSDISPIKAKVNANMTDAINQIVDTAVLPIQSLHKGIVKIFTAYTGTWLANKEAQNRLIAAQIEKDVEDIKAGRKEYRNLNLITLGLSQDPKVYYKQISDNNEVCNARRLDDTIHEAALELSKIPEEEIADEPLNQTFFNHWRAEAELIDEEGLRKLWARLLVEETKKTHSVSLRTLDVVKNLSKQEAEAFCRIAKGVVDNAVVAIHNGAPIFGQYNEILALQDARLIGSQISTVTVLANNEYLPKKAIIIPFFESNIAIAIEEKEISFNIYPLTMAGREIYAIIKSRLELNEIISIVNEISKQNQNAISNILPIKIINSDPNGNIKYQYFWNPIWSNHPTMSHTENTKS